MLIGYMTLRTLNPLPNVFMLGRAYMSWKFSKKTYILISIMKSELIPFDKTIKEGIKGYSKLVKANSSDLCPIQHLVSNQKDIK
jgi:hypothetical protein